MYEYRTEDGRLFASGKFATAHYLHEVSKNLRFLEKMLEAWDDREEHLSPETNEVLDKCLDQVLGSELIPDMRACLRAWEAYQSE